MLGKQENDEELIISEQTTTVNMIAIYGHYNFWKQVPDHREFKNCCLKHYRAIFITVIFIAFLVIGIIVGELAKARNDGTISVGGFSFSNGTEEYPIASYAEGLNIIDFTYLTMVAYNEEEFIKDDITRWFGEDYVKNGTLSIETNPDYFSFEDEHGTYIVSVRGTADLRSVFEDVSLWSEIVSFQVGGSLLPLYRMLPTGFIRDFIHITSYPEDMIDKGLKSNYYTPVYNHIKNDIISENEYKKIFVAGHSLGMLFFDVLSPSLLREATNIQEEVLLKLLQQNCMMMQLLMEDIPQSNHLVYHLQELYIHVCDV